MGETERADPMRAVEGLAGRLFVGELTDGAIDVAGVMGGFVSSTTGLTSSSSPSVLLSSSCTPKTSAQVKSCIREGTHRTKQGIIILVLVIIITAHLSARLFLPPQPLAQLSLPLQLGLLSCMHHRVHFVV